MKYFLLSLVALAVTVTSVDAQRRPAGAGKHKKQMGKHQNGPSPKKTSVTPEKN